MCIFVSLPGVKNDDDKRLKYHKERELEQQRHKLQQAFSQSASNKHDSQLQRDAMIAQIIGPLPGAKPHESSTRQQQSTVL